jgi:hypothetical protein
MKIIKELILRQNKSVVSTSRRYIRLESLKKALQQIMETSG